MNATEFVKIVENRLGWVPPKHTGLGWRQYRIEAAKVNRKMATNPQLYTFDNLLLAVELLVREKRPRNPIGVFSHVERAVEKARVPDHEIELLIRKACGYEYVWGDPHGWIVRFARAQGSYRREALDEWRASRGSAQVLR